MKPLTRIETDLLIPNVIEAMAAKELSQGEVARRTGLARERISRLLHKKERGSFDSWQLIWDVTVDGPSMAEVADAVAQAAIEAHQAELARERDIIAWLQAEERHLEQLGAEEDAYWARQRAEEQEAFADLDI